MKSYLEKTLVGYGAGFHFTVPPPPGVERLSHLASPDPEEVIACVLANFQRARFDVADALVPLLKGTDSFWVWSAGAHLLSAAAPAEHVRELLTWAEAGSDQAAQYRLCLAALLRGWLWAVEPTLRALPTFRDPALALILETALSWLLEERDGAIYEGPEEVELPPEAQTWDPSPQLVSDELGYAERVRERVRQVGQPEGRTIFAEGEPISVIRIAERLLEQLRSPGGTGPRIDHSWRVFNASTGVDCRDFFDAEGNPRRLTGAVILEDYLRSGAGKALKPGVRYFFGHQVPD